jgi:hypothetical protein
MAEAGATGSHGDGEFIGTYIACVVVPGDYTQAAIVRSWPVQT